MIWFGALRKPASAPHEPQIAKLIDRMAYVIVSKLRAARWADHMVVGRILEIIVSANGA
jgi:hypothetical protein